MKVIKNLKLASILFALTGIPVTSYATIYDNVTINIPGSYQNGTHVIGSGGRLPITATCSQNGPDTTQCHLKIAETFSSEDGWVTIGTDYSHYCQFLFTNSWYSPLSYISGPNCSVGKGADILYSKSMHSFYTKMW